MPLPKELKEYKLYLRDMREHVVKYRETCSINKRLQKEENLQTRLYWYTQMLIGLLCEVRSCAESHKEESILLTHESLLDNILKLHAMIPCFTDEDQVQSVIRKLYRESEWYNDGELITVDEDTYLRRVESTLLHFHQDLLKERRAKFKIFHEELIMKAMEPERVKRFASAAGLDFIDYMILME